MSQLQKVGTVHTTVFNSLGSTYVRYHNTDVVRFNDSEITLKTNGWYTQTTKNRMNQAANQYNLGFSVSQRDWKWYVMTPDGEIPFTDGMTIKRS